MYLIPKATAALAITLILLIATYFVIPATQVRADELEDIQKQINDLNKARELSQAATKPLEGQVQSLRIQLAQIQANVKALSAKIDQKEKDVNQRAENLAMQQALLEERIRSYYVRSYQTSPFLLIFSNQGVASVFRELFFRQATTKEDRKIITNVTGEIVTLLSDKEKLEKDKLVLAGLQAQVDKNATFLDGEIKKAQAYQSDLSSKIAQLSARQQAILSAKSGTFTTSVGDVPLADDPNSAPSYNPGFSPAFAAFSFGAYTHRHGMSQYGAKGRAESGQSAEQILSAYYPGSHLNKSYSMPSTINVDGYGSMSFEDQYLMRIYEMPNSFPMEALKAQAVAARTYAVRQGGSICPTESCQVYKNSDKGGAWADAVRATRGWVLEGGPNAQYSSTTGGYSTDSGWDTKCGSKNCWTGDAYEKIAGSPWFYKGWYKDRSGNSCGRTNPWLNNEEMSDILNSWIVYQSGTDRDRISPVNTSCWPGNPFSMSEMKDKASNNGGSVTTVTNVNVVYSENGSTANVSFTTNRGNVTIAGSDFQTIFNLRAPGYVSIKSPLFNMEQR